jgi:hypothetical protein
MKSHTLLIACCSTALLVSGLDSQARGKGGGAAGQGQGQSHNKGQQGQKSREQAHSNGHGADDFKHHGTKDPWVNQRQENQRDRVRQGIKSGQLTKEEAKELATNQKELRQEEKEYKSDGTLTKEERVDLHQDLNSTSKDIYQEKHDAETQPGVTPAEPGSPKVWDPKVNQLQSNQKDRIQQGVQSGELTKKETYTLAQKEAHLAKLERQLKEDGKLTKEERARLQKRLDWISADIYKQKHDDQERK